MDKKIFGAVLVALMTIMPVIIADDVSVTANVSKYITVTFNYNSVGFGTLTAGSNNNHPTPDYTTGIYNVTIDTNYAYRSKVNGTNFDDGGGHTFGIGNLTVDADETLLSLNPVQAVTGTPTQVTASSTTGTAIDDYHGYLLDIPANQYSASYTATVTWTYENQ